MKWLNFKPALLAVCIMIFSVTTSKAQEEYKENVQSYVSQWNKLIPRYFKAQYAGGMGLFALGTGWDYGRKKQWESDILVGWVPKYSSDRSKVIFTLKQNYIPWSVKINKDFILRPLHTGLYVNSIIGRDYWVSEPEKYPNSYYAFSTKLRFNVFVGQQITYIIPHKERTYGKSATFYYEISSNDLYILSAAKNSYLKPDDYLRLSFGVKFQVL
ncbi:MAG: hypothetical protein V4581_12665 [Bacteroidota bacterium]